MEKSPLRPLADLLPTYLVHGRADNTVKTYSSGFRSWKTWADLHQVRHLPANPVTFALYLMSLVQRGSNWAKIEGIFYAVKYFHTMVGLADPTEHTLVTQMVEVGKRLCTKPINRKEPINQENIQAIYKKFGGENMTLMDLRTFVLILLGFCGFLRYDELSNLRYRDISFHNVYMKLFIEKSKQDQYRLGKWAHISCGTTYLCPVKNLAKYANLAKLKKRQYIFRAVIRSKNSEKLSPRNRPLSYTRAREVIRNAVERIGLDKSKFATHSLRSGGATAAANLGVPDRLFKRHGRWRSERAKDMYVKDDLRKLLSVTKTMNL